MQEVIALWKVIPRKYKIVLAIAMTLSLIFQGPLTNILSDFLWGANAIQFGRHVKATYVPLEDTVRAYGPRIGALESASRVNDSRLTHVENAVKADSESIGIISRSVLDLGKIDERKWRVQQDLIKTVNSHTEKLYKK